MNLPKEEQLKKEFFSLFKRHSPSWDELADFWLSKRQEELEELVRDIQAEGEDEPVNEFDRGFNFGLAIALQLINKLRNAHLPLRK